MEHVLWLIFTPICIIGITKYLTHKNVRLWSVQRWIYLSSSVVIATSALATGLQVFIHDESYREVAKFGPALLSMTMAIIPCGISYFNRPGIRILRNLAFVLLGVLWFVKALANT